MVRRLVLREAPLRIGSIIALSIAGLFLLTGLVTLLVAIYDPAW